MVEVEVRNTPFGYDYIRAKHHAGDPLICSAVSAIMMGLVGTLLNVNPKPTIISQTVSDGYVEVEISPMLKEQDRAVLDAVFLFAIISLMQIQKAHPSKIKVCNSF